MSSASTSKFVGDAARLRDYYTRQLVKYYLAANLGDRQALPYAEILASPEFYAALGLEAERMSQPEYLRDALHRLAEGKNEAGGYLSPFFAPPNRTMIAEDVTISAPKSVSVAYALASDDETRRKIELAHRRAVAAAHERIKRDLGFARMGKDGLVRTRAEISIFAIHQTDARPTSAGAPPMPHLHSHGVIPNVAYCPIDGKIRAIDFRGLDPLAYSTVYQTVLAEELRAAGFTLRQGRHSFEIATISDELVDRFSPRAAEIRQAAEMLAAAEDRDPETLSSSERKLLERRAQKEKLEKNPEFEDLDRCLDAWRERAGENAPASMFGGEATPIEESLRLCREALQEHAESVAVVDRSKIDAMIAAHTLAMDISADERAELSRELFDEFFLSTTGLRKMSQGAIEEALAAEGVDARVDGASVERAVSKLALAGERFALETTEQLARTDAGLALDIEAALATKSLTEEQANAVREVANGKQIEFFRGGAGVGKTYSLSPLVEAQIAAGGRVFGAAVANKIAFALTDAGIPASNAMSLTKLSGLIDQGKIKLDSKAMIVIDEASMIGLLEINKIFDAARESGARIVIVGDDSQIDAVGLQSLELIQEGLRRAGNHARSVLTTVRQKNDVERAIASAFRNGIEANTALCYLDDHSRLKFGQDRDHVLRMCASQWNAARDADAGHVFIAPTNREAQEVALAIRNEREKRGDLRGEEISVGIVGNGSGDADDAENSMLLREGDRVRFFDRVTEQRGRAIRNLCVNGTVARFVRIETDEDGYQFIVAERLDKHDRVEKDSVAVAARARELAEADRRNGSSWEKLPKKKRDEFMEQARRDPALPTAEFRVPVEKIRDGETGRLRLAYADASTVHSAQGISASRTTGVALDGTKMINSKLGYVTASRHEHEFTFICNGESLDREIRQNGVTGTIERHDRVSALARAFTRDVRRQFAVSVVDGLQLEDERMNALTREQIRATLSGERRGDFERKDANYRAAIDAARAEEGVEQAMPAVEKLKAATQTKRGIFDRFKDAFAGARDRLAEIFDTAKLRRDQASRAEIERVAERRDLIKFEREGARLAPAMRVLARAAETRKAVIENVATMFQKAKPTFEKLRGELSARIGKRRDDAQAMGQVANGIEKLAPAVEKLKSAVAARSKPIAEVEAGARTYLHTQIGDEGVAKFDEWQKKKQAAAASGARLDEREIEEERQRRLATRVKPVTH